MVDTSGQLHLLDKLKLASVGVEDRSLHPTDYASRLTATEITNIVAYLHTLRGPDPAKTAVAPMLPGGVTYERLFKSESRTS